MKIFKKIMLSMLIIGNTYSISFGMKYVGLWQKFCLAASTGDTDQVKQCLEILPDPGLRSYFIRSNDEFGYTALLYAAMHNHGDIVRILIEAVQDQEQNIALITEICINNLTALHLAIMYRYTSVASILLEYYKQLTIHIPQDLDSTLKELGLEKQFIKT